MRGGGGTLADSSDDQLELKISVNIAVVSSVSNAQVWPALALRRMQPNVERAIGWTWRQEIKRCEANKCKWGGTFEAAKLETDCAGIFIQNVDQVL